MERFTSEQPRKASSAFSDNLTTLMFFDASDLSEAQRERERDSQVPFLSGRMNVPAHTLESVRTVFLELFWTPKSSMENPSLHTWADKSAAWTEHLSWKTALKTNLDNGPKIKRLARKAALIMRDHVSGHGTTLSVPRSPDHSRAARWKEEKKREKEKARNDPKGPEEHSLAMNRYKIPNGGQKRTLPGGPKERKARNDKWCRQGSSSPKKPKAEERITKEEAKKAPFLNPDCRPQKDPMKKDTAAPGNWTIWSSNHWTDESWTPDAGWFFTKAYTAWMVASPLNLANHPTHVFLDLGCTRSIGSTSAIERFKKHACYYGIPDGILPLQ